MECGRVTSDHTKTTWAVRVRVVSVYEVVAHARGGSTMEMILHDEEVYIFFLDVISFLKIISSFEVLSMIRDPAILAMYKKSEVDTLELDDLEEKEMVTHFFQLRLRCTYLQT
ncbi:unnamed protein product [Cuscuta epithymum]|uniref:Uncharacterized protein n=1 Tax=Cuscuta epithymum TaxID=186058 RepID=A0AAV0BY99_9ASTE|nr:unnamed protein product [Cuscuta epithymum]